MPLAEAGGHSRPNGQGPQRAISDRPVQPLADVDGLRLDALLYSLLRNAAHGLQRNAHDYGRAHEIACRNGLVDPTDAEAVAALLRCSVRTAKRFIKAARVAAKAARDAAILADINAGKSNKAIARETGVPETTVRRIGRALFPPLAPWYRP